jgi:hypothetical protein
MMKKALAFPFRYGNMGKEYINNREEKLEIEMKKTIIGVILPVCLVTAILFFATAAAALTNEQECINGGGYVAEGSGCKFCVGGKFDLSEVKGSDKKNTTPSRSDQRLSGKNSDQSGANSRVDNGL